MRESREETGLDPQEGARAGYRATERVGLVRREDLVRDLERLGMPVGGLVMVHSSLASMGFVRGGAETVVDVLLESLGPDGTLVVPTFSWQGEGIFDPRETPSKMGAISEAARRRRSARRSIHLQHSIAVIGPLAEEIATSGGPSAFSADDPMGQLFQRSGWFLLLGVPYLRLTAMHWCEVAVGVPYRRPKRIEGRMRRPDGAVVPLVSIGAPPDPGFGGNDFNYLGKMMEDRGLVRVGEVGNAIARLIAAEDLLATSRREYESDEKLFIMKEPKVVRLEYGETIERGDRGAMCVKDVAQVYASAARHRGS